MNPAWQTLLTELRGLHERLPELQAFCAFPDPITDQQITPRHDPLADAMCADQNLTAPPAFVPARDAILATAASARWRDTYADTGYGVMLHAHFGCFELMGRETPLGAHGMRGFMIYQKPGFHYPMHHHPAEEIYLVIAGEGAFHLEGEPSQDLRPGDVAFHPSNVPHALTTGDAPILAYVLWRGDLATKPVWSDPERLS